MGWGSAVVYNTPKQWPINYENQNIVKQNWNWNPWEILNQGSNIRPYSLAFDSAFDFQKSRLNYTYWYVLRSNQYDKVCF